MKKQKLITILLTAATLLNLVTVTCILRKNTLLSNQVEKQQNIISASVPLAIHEARIQAFREELNGVIDDNALLREQLNSVEQLLNYEDASFGVFELSAYAPFDNQSGECADDTPDTTSIGMTPGPNVIAVDPEVIPYGSTVLIVYEDGNYLLGTAGDTGGAIQGNRLDIFKWTYDEAIAFGRKQATVVWF